MSSTEDRAPRKVLLNQPLNWTEWGLSEQAKALRFAEDEAGNLWAFPCVLAGSNQAGSSINVATLGGGGDGTASSSPGKLHVRAEQYVYNPTSGFDERQRTPTFWKVLRTTVSATIWTPTSGKKFRLMGGLISLSKEVAAAGECYLTLTDGGTSFFTIQFSLVALVATGNFGVFPFSFPGNGYLSTAVDALLAVAFSSALTAGQCGISVWGTEE